MLYALSLDLRFRRFPEVLVGAAEILVVVFVLGALARHCWWVARRPVRRRALESKRPES